MASAASTLLCALRFWAGGAGAFSKTTPTLRASVRAVARKQGHSPSALDKAERQLVKRGLIKKSAKNVKWWTQSKGLQTGGAATLALTSKGLRVSKRACPAVSLAPWRNDDFGRGGRRK